MDDLLREFLTETSESLDTVDNQLVKFEQEPNNAKILDNVFRLVHTIKGTCGFLGLPRLGALAHAGETLMGKFRDGMPVTAEAVTLILSSIDRIKEILGGLEATEAEPEGDDQDLISALEAMVERGMAAMSGSAEPMPGSAELKAGSAQPEAAPAPVASEPAEVVAPPLAPEPEAGLTMTQIVSQKLERPLRPGEVSLDELERAFRETVTQLEPPSAAAPAPSQPPQAAASNVSDAPAPAADIKASDVKAPDTEAAEPKAAEQKAPNRRPRMRRPRPSRPSRSRRRRPPPIARCTRTTRSPTSRSGSMSTRSST